MLYISFALEAIHREFVFQFRSTLEYISHARYKT